MRSAHRLLAASLSLLLTALACNLPGASVDNQALLATSVAMTQTAQATDDAGASPTEAVTSTPSATFTASPTATITQTPTPEFPTANLSENTNCRTGPGLVYDLIRTLLRGDSARILGRNTDGTYWYIQDPSRPGDDCWLWGRYVQVSGSTDQLPVFTPPPTPTPSFVWTGTWETWIDANMGTLVLTQSGNSISGTLTGSGETFTISGTTSEGGRVANGEVRDAADVLEATFSWRMRDSTNQFTGTWSDPPDDGVWCGARNGAAKPDPCAGP